MEATSDKILYHQRGYKYDDKPRETSYRNVLWFWINKYFVTMFGRSNFSYYAHFDIYGNPVDSQNRCGNEIYIHTSLSSCFEPEITFSYDNQRYKFRPHSNRVISEDFIKEQVFAYVNKHILFVSGIFRDFQILHNLTKKETIERYRFHLQQKKLEASYYDRTQEVYDYIYKKYNVCLEHDFGDDDKAYNYVFNMFKSGKEKRKDTCYIRTLRPFEMLDGFDGDIDEIEEYLEENYDYPNDNTIYL
jgi:hypothetical protein